MLLVQNPVLTHTTLRVTVNVSGLIELFITSFVPCQYHTNGIGPPVCPRCCSVTTPVRESPFFLMFGQEPRLTVDFLLGRVQDPVPGKVQDWVVEHQARLRVAFEGTRERLLAAASKRKERESEMHLSQ